MNHFQNALLLVLIHPLFACGATQCGPGATATPAPAPSTETDRPTETASQTRPTGTASQTRSVGGVEIDCADYERQVGLCEETCPECVGNMSNSCMTCAQGCADRIFCQRCNDEMKCPDCGDTSDMKAHRYDAARRCVAAEAIVGCTQADVACGDAITYATDSDGTGWWFSDTCIPEGWTAAPYPDGFGDVPPACPN